MNVFYKFFVLLATVGLLACTSKPTEQDYLSMALAQKAQELNTQLPIKRSGISLVSANAREHSLELQFWQVDDTNNSDYFLNNYKATLCKQYEVNALINKGATYKLTLMSVGKPTIQSDLNRCEGRNV